MRFARFCVAAFVFLCPLLLSAQAICDPNDPLYLYLDAWEGKGLLANLPRLRPYSADMLRTLLGEVSARGGQDDASLAAEFGSRLTGFSIHPGVSHQSTIRDAGYAGYTGAGGSAFAELLPSISWGGRLRLWFVDGTPQALEPVGERPPIDLSEDAGTFSIPLAGRDLFYRHDIVTSMGVGNGSLAMQAGLTRASFGPFFENGLVIGPQAPVSGNFILNWRLEGLNLYQGLFCLVERLPNGILESNKYLSFHGVGATLLPWLSIDLFESVVWSGRFDPLYLIPGTELFYMQSLAGFGDNSFIGLSGEVRVTQGLDAKGLVYFDDSMEVAGQAGLQWAPESPVFRTVSLDYTFVLPYTYSHVVSDAYTNWGVNEGPALEPNSDRLEARAFITPIPALELEATARLIRHGNASESVVPGGDGSILDPGYVGGVPSFVTAPWKLQGWESLRFLTQAVIDTSLQAGIRASWRIGTGWGTVTLTGRSLVEYRLNEGIVAGNDLFHVYLSLGLEYSY